MHPLLILQFKYHNGTYNKMYPDRKQNPPLLSAHSLVVFIGVQRVNGFKSGRGSEAAYPSTLSPLKTHVLSHDQTCVNPAIKLKYLLFFSHTALPKAALIKKYCSLFILKWPAAEVSTSRSCDINSSLASPNCARLLC